MRKVKLAVTFTLICGLSLIASLAIALTPNPVEEGTPKYGGIIRYVQIVGPGGFDLHTRPAWSGSPLVPIFNNLVIFNPDYQETTVDNLIGDLAERFEVSEDGTELTFWLRKNVQWHDGEPFTADDVVYSMEKMTDPKTGSRVSRWLAAYERTEKIDDYTVKIYTQYPSPGFLVNLANAYCVIEAEHLKDVDPKSTDFLIGTGPYKFKSYIPDAKWSMVRNPNYFKKDDAGRQLPYLDGLEIIIGRGTTALDALIAKRVQLYNPVQVVANPEDVARVRSSAPEVELTLNRNFFPYLIWVNWEAEALKSQKVRDAIGLIYDQKDEIIARWGSLDFGVVGPGIFPPSFGIEPEEVSKIMGWDMSWDERVKKAKQLMKEAGYPDGGFTVRLLHGIYPGGTSEPSMLVLGDKLKRHLNIDYEMIGLQYGEMHKVRAKGDWEMANEVIYALLPDPDVYMPYFKSGTPSNFTRYSNPKVDELWEKQNREMNPDKRAAIMRDIERILLKDHVVFPGAFQVGYLAMYPSVKNLRFTAQTYGCEVKFEDVWLDE